MATPVDAAAIVAQFTGLAFQAFEGCIEAYKFWVEARNIERDSDLLKTRFYLEKYRLEQWGSRSGLDSSQPRETLNWPAILEILRHQQELLTSGEKLRKRYYIYLPKDDATDVSEVDGDKDVNIAEGLNRLLRALRPELYQESPSKQPSAKLSIGKRIRWAALGKDQLTKVIDDLGKLNSELERQLGVAEQEWLCKGVNALLREMLSRATTLEDVTGLLSVIQPVSSSQEAQLLEATRFKRLRLYLGVDRRKDEIRPAVSKDVVKSLPVASVSEKNLKKLVFGNDDPNTSGMLLATYDRKIVLVEWRDVPDQNSDLVWKSLKQFTMLLQNIEESFATLRCMGLVRDDKSKQKRCGLLFELPRQLVARETSECQQQNLLEKLADDPKHSLAERFKVALRIAEAVCQLHTSGWLHKNLRSQNILFFGKTASDPAEVIWTGPYISGYGHSRPDTAEAAQAMTRLPSTSLMDDLYRHPRARGSNRASFKKCFDLYGLGCILVEIALWTKLVDVLSGLEAIDLQSDIATADRENQDMAVPSLSEHVDKPGFLKLLRHSVTENYVEAIMLCLKAASLDEDTDDISVKTQTTVVEKLRECK